MKSEKDDRFKKISTDPKFKEIPKKIRKVEIKDPRFASMFTNKSFNEGLEYDMYGRKVDSNNKKELERYYHIEEDEAKDIEEDEVEDAEFIEDGDSDTSEEFEQFLQERTEMNAEDPFDEIEEKNIPTGDETHRISVMNIDWENIHAQDLFVLFSSFCKGKQKILKVEIFPSEFGIKEMERETREGPAKEIFEDNNVKHNKKNKSHDEDFGEIIHNLDDAVDDNTKTDGVNQLKLRKYELRKLKYYYAIITFDSKETAFSIYSECDGMEIERTQNFMDLRFVPDELTEFPYKPREVCTKPPVEYNPKFHSNSALQHSNVKLTWEAENPKRNELIQKAFSKQQFNQEEIQQLLMSSDSETDEDAKAFAEEMFKDEGDNDVNLLKRKKNKDLKIKEGETIEISFNKGFEGVNDNITINKAGAKDKSMWESYMEKKKNIRREKKMEERQKREEKKTKRTVPEDQTAKKKELNLLIDSSLQNKQFKYNSNDSRFSALGKDTKFAVDPTSNEYKKQKKNK
jgi:hypothetical protein